MSYQKVYMNQIYSSSIMRQVAQMWKNQLLCDAVIKTGNIQTKAHRLVLIAACPMLQDIENASVGSHLEVRLNSDISQAAVNTFLQYLYEGYMMLSEENCREVEKIAKMLHVDSISKCCSDFQKCMAAKMGYSSTQVLNFDLQDNPDFRFVNATDLRKMVPDFQNKRQMDEMNSSTSASKRPRSQNFSSLAPHGPDDHLSMSESYSSSSTMVPSKIQGEGVIDITESSVELVNTGPGARDSEGWPINTDLPPLTTSSSLAMKNQQEATPDLQIIDIPPIRGEKPSSAAFSRIHDSKSRTLVAGSSSGISERSPNIPSHSPGVTGVTRHTEDRSQYMVSNSARENIPRLSPLRSSPPKLIQQKQKGAPDDASRSFALGSATPDHRPFPIHSNSSVQPVDVIQNTMYTEPQTTDTDIHRKTLGKPVEEHRATVSPDPIIVKLEDDTAESGSLEMYIQNPSNESYSQDPDGEMDPDLSNDDSFDPGPSYSTQDDQSQGTREGREVGWPFKQNCGSIQCKKCGQTFSSTESLVIHLKEVEKKKFVKVCKCGEVFSLMRTYRYHLQIKHGEGTSCPRCSLCGSYFQDNYNLKRHMLTHRSTCIYMCNTCGEICKNQNSLADHQRICNPKLHKDSNKPCADKDVK